MHKYEIGVQYSAIGVQYKLSDYMKYRTITVIQNKCYI